MDSSSSQKSKTDQLAEEQNTSSQEPVLPEIMHTNAFSQLSGSNTKQDKLIDKIKINIYEIINGSQQPIRVNFSNYLSTKLRYNYTYMANLFSKAQGITIEHYIILSKIEKVKELLILGKLNLTEISYMLHYSSVAHLSFQFKKVTGLTPSSFKQLTGKH